MIEQGDLLNIHLQYKTTLKVYHEAETLNIDDETLRERIEADMDFKIPGLPHSVVKHAQSTSVRELIQKIENHPNQPFHQQDLRHNQSFYPLSSIKTNDSGGWKYRIV